MTYPVKGEHLFKHYKKQVVLDDVSLTLQEGEIYGLIGPSGAGKTTLVRILLGLEKADKGAVELFEQRPTLGAFRSLGYMAQSDALYNELNAWQNLDFFASIQGMHGKEKKRRILEVAKQVGLSQDLKKTVGDFSGGMKRRLSLAAALVHQPRLYLLDEPTVGLDPMIRRDIWTLFHYLRSKGATMIVTTHVMDEVSQCDRVGLLSGGHLIAEGAPKELTARYGVKTVEDVFLAEEGAKK
ncbi:ABC transporter ATP-binding protein [Sporolactobacillus sp. Y61]|jgi:ABC-2 type transport system ATP-binding protein|uniref:ABC transporter ATP-binding protein n=1 Tax=Sporolactobacillus sp. Y61 TaxID=3160863 RepID=A0AAU8IH86_9BACL|nr:ABC transporter ATP-binding protein [Sporolactobacillus sp. THM19-2]RYL94095.1 ABC transporter ATP-binding protein [Sporolactobacillus sp. THM19-2]